MMETSRVDSVLPLACFLTAICTFAWTSDLLIACWVFVSLWQHARNYRRVRWTENGIELILRSVDINEPKMNRTANERSMILKTVVFSLVLTRFSDTGYVIACMAADYVCHRVCRNIIAKNESDVAFFAVGLLYAAGPPSTEAAETTALSVTHQKISRAVP